MFKLRYFVGLLIVCALCIATAGAASAHAEPERAIPPINGKIEVGPAQLEIWFSEEITEDTTVKVTDVNGNQVDLGKMEFDLQDPNRQHLTVPLQPNLPQGEYTVAWASVSGEDGDSDSGTFTFTVLTGTPVASPVASPIASPDASPAASPASTVAGAVNTPGDETVDSRAVTIALAVGFLAALAIFGFWQLVKPRGDEIYKFDDQQTENSPEA